MKVRTTEDPKHMVTGDTPGISGQVAYNVDYDDRAMDRQSTFVTYARNVLMVLSILALILACLIFARDLQETNAPFQDKIRSSELLSTTNRPTFFPRTEEWVDNEFPTFTPSPKPMPEPKENGKVITKTTKITVDMTPGSPPIERETVETSVGTPFDDQLPDIFKIMNNFLGPHFGGNLPFFNDRREPHPKMVVVKTIKPVEPKNEDQDLIIKDLLDKVFGGFGDEKPGKSEPETFPDPFGIFSGESPMDSRPFPVPFMFKFSFKPSKPKNDWDTYREIISKMSGTVDSFSSAISSLKEEIQSTQNSKYPGDEKTLNEALDGLNKINEALNKVSVITKTEDGALKLVTRTDKEGLIKVIQTFNDSIEQSMDAAYTGTTNLSKAVSDLKDLPQSISSGVIELGEDLITFGKLFYEDLSQLKSRLMEPKEEKPKTEQSSKEVEPKKEQTLKEFHLPSFNKRILFI